MPLEHKGVDECKEGRQLLKNKQYPASPITSLGDSLEEKIVTNTKTHVDRQSWNDTPSRRGTRQCLVDNDKDVGNGWATACEF